jgi:histidyl-tRNA synthetase
LKIDFELAPRLVRGFDYYTRTTFEFQTTALDAAQNALGGGGRYDGLAEEMGGPPTPGIGFGAGIERIVLALEAQSAGSTTGAVGLDGFVVNGLGEGGSTRATVLVTALRDAGLAVDRAYGDRSVAAQWKAADRSGARFGIMLGRDEVQRGAVAVKDLGSGEQVEVEEVALASWLRDRCGGSAAAR